MRVRRALLVVFLLASSLCADTYPRQPGVDVQHYIFRVTLGDDSDAISGETTVTVRFVEDGLAEWGSRPGFAGQREGHDGDGGRQRRRAGALHA